MTTSMNTTKAFQETSNWAEVKVMDLIFAWVDVHSVQANYYPPEWMKYLLVLLDILPELHCQTINTPLKVAYYNNKLSMYKTE